jgi:transcriptional regulator with XRE-family HTH domain
MIKEKYMKEESVFINLPDRYFNRVIKEYREMQKLNQKEMAKKLSVSQAVISYIETGSSPMKANTFVKYCDKLGIKASTFMYS